MLKRTLASHTAAYLTNKHRHKHTSTLANGHAHTCIQPVKWEASVGVVCLALPAWPSQVICEYAPARIQVFSLYLVLSSVVVVVIVLVTVLQVAQMYTFTHTHTQTQTTYHKCILKCTYTIFTFDMSSTNEMHKNVLFALALSYQHTHTYIIYYYYYNYNYYLYIINNFWSKFEVLICIYSIYFLCFLSRVNAILFSMLL